MLPRSVVTAVLSTAAVMPATTLAQAPTPAVTTAFVDVAVVPMDTERTLANQTVVVRDGRIVAMGPADRVKVPKGAVRLDGRGKFLMPGLGDMHTHVHVHFPRTPAADSLLIERMLFLYLANGVTTIRNMQDIEMTWRKRAAAGMLWSPRIYSSGHKLIEESFPSQAHDSIVNIVSPKDAANAIAREKAAGYDFLKIYDLGPETFDSVVAAAKRLGIGFAGHVPPAIPLTRALEAGYASIEHLTGYAKADSAELVSLIDATKRAGVWNVPTYTVTHNFSIDPEKLAQQPEMRYIAPERLQHWSSRGTAPQAGASHRRILKAMREGHAKLLLASDSPDNFGVPGFSIHRELEAMVGIGFTPYQVLETGTRNVAEFFGTLDSTGTVAVGKRADLVLLNGNPLADIRNTSQPAGVMVGGRWLDRAEIDRRLATMDESIH